MHLTQRDILNSLRKTDSRKFSELLLEVAETSDNLTYHLKQLQKCDFIESPTKGQYKLARKGLTYLNNNLELQNELFPTVSCMLELHSSGDEVLVMRKLKQPYLGSVHLPTFGVESNESLEEQIENFLNRYCIGAKNITFRGVHRERTVSAHGRPFFDKFFMVFQGKLVSFKHDVDDREFVVLSSRAPSTHSQLLPASKAVLSYGSEVAFVESVSSE